MKRGLRLFRGTVILAIVVAAALYTQRVNLGDYWRAMNAPALPEAVTYEDVVEDAEGVDAVEDEPEAVAAREDEIVAVLDEEPPVIAPAPAEDSPTVEPSTATPAEFNLAVPFTSQAPFGVWDEVHEETCEEASAYMVHAFYQGVSGVIAPQTAEDELQRIVAKEMEIFGFYKDTSAAETAVLVKALYGYARVDVVADPTAEDIKGFIAAGHPVIVPAAGRMLGNPNFTGLGPPYHMIVVRGYTETHFITNDPGTRNGEQYVYSVGTLMNAMHDWNGGDVENGEKVVVVIYPN